MFVDGEGPIEQFSWGVFVVRGEKHGKAEARKFGKGKDIRIVGTKVTRWKERDGHALALDRVTKVFDRGIGLLIIGNGVEGALECPDEVIAAIRVAGIPQVIVARTPEACRVYNEHFRADDAVALLAHGTC